MSPLPDRAHDPALLARLDDVLLAMRRISVKPPVMAVPIPGTNRRIDFAKLLACGAIDRLSREGEPVTVKAVASLLDLEHSTASRLLTEAEADGLVDRTPHPTDRRATALAITDEGRAVADGFRMARLGFIAGSLADWSPAQVETFTDLLDKFVTTVTVNKQCWADWVDGKPTS